MNIQDQPGWYSEMQPGQSYLEKDVSLGDARDRVVTVLGPAQGRFVRPAWRILVRDPNGELRIKDIHFFYGHLKRIF